MTADKITSNLEAFLDFMKDRGYPVFHKSNVFRRDMQYAVRDYIRFTTKKDVGTRDSDAAAEGVLSFMESKGYLVPLRGNTWLLEMERYSVQPEPEETPQEDAQNAA